MRNFIYHRPQTIAAASALLMQPEAKLMSGGMSLLPSMKLRLNDLSHVVDLGGVAGLSGVEADEGGVVIGARTPHVQVANSATLHDRLPALAELAEGIGDPLVRNRGTIGGSIANADPAADYPCAVLALRSVVVTNKRQISGDAFFTGLFETALDPGEIITAVRLSCPRRAAYVKYRHPASRFAVIGVFVADFGDEVRVAVTGASSHVFRVAEYESKLRENFSVAAIENVEPRWPPMNADLFASPDFRAHLAAEMTRRAVAAAADRKHGSDHG